MNKKVVVMTFIWCICTAFAGTVEKTAKNAGAEPVQKKDVVKKSSHFVFTEAAKKEFKNQKNKKWLITYNGTCGDAPSLGFYPEDGGAGSGCLKVKHEGVVIMVEKKIVSLFDTLGDITVDCVDYNGDKPDGKQFMAEFKKGSSDPAK